MKRYVSIDSGKFATKIAWVNSQLTRIQRCQYRTKVSHGVMEDDAIENGTYAPSQQERYISILLKIQELRQSSTSAD